MIDKGPSNSGAQDPLGLASSQSSQEPSTLRGDIDGSHRLDSRGDSARISKSVSARSQIIKYIWPVQGYGLLLLIVLSFFPRLFHLEEYLFFALLPLAALARWWEGQKIWVRTPIDRPLWFFIGWVLITIPFAQDPAYSFSEWCKLVAQALVFHWAVAVSAYWGSKETNLQTYVIHAVYAGTILVSLWGLIDFFARGGTFTDRIVRAAAPSSDYNWLGTYLVMGLPFLILQYWLAMSTRIRAFYGVTLALGAMTLFVTYSRAAWLGVAGQALAFGLLTKRYKWVAGTVGMAVLIGLILFVAVKVGYQKDTVDLWTLHTRLDAWGKGLHVMLAHPVVGIGYGYHTFEPLITGHSQGNGPIGLHNTFMMVGVGTGFIGLYAFSWLLVRIVSMCLSQYASAFDRQTSVFALAVAVMIIGFAIRNVFDYMFAGGAGYLFGMLVGICHSMADHKISSGRLTEKRGHVRYQFHCLSCINNDSRKKS